MHDSRIASTLGGLWDAGVYIIRSAIGDMHYQKSSGRVPVSASALGRFAHLLRL